MTETLNMCANPVCQRDQCKLTELSQIATDVVTTLSAAAFDLEEACVHEQSAATMRQCLSCLRTWFTRWEAPHVELPGPMCAQTIPEHAVGPKGGA